MFRASPTRIPTTMIRRAARRVDAGDVEDDGDVVVARTKQLTPSQLAMIRTTLRFHPRLSTTTTKMTRKSKSSVVVDAAVVGVDVVRVKTPKPAKARPRPKTKNARRARDVRGTIVTTRTAVARLRPVDAMFRLGWKLSKCWSTPTSRTTKSLREAADVVDPVVVAGEAGTSPRIGVWMHDRLVCDRGRRFVLPRTHNGSPNQCRCAPVVIPTSDGQDRLSPFGATF